MSSSGVVVVSDPSLRAFQLTSNVPECDESSVTVPDPSNRVPFQAVDASLVAVMADPPVLADGRGLASPAASLNRLRPGGDALTDRSPDAASERRLRSDARVRAARAGRCPDALQQQVQLAAEAVPERRVQERGDERRRRGDGQRPRHAGEVQQQPERRSRAARHPARSAADADPRARSGGFSRGRMTRRKRTPYGCVLGDDDAPQEQRGDEQQEEEAGIGGALRDRRGRHPGRTSAIPVRPSSTATNSRTAVTDAAKRGPRGSMPAGCGSSDIRGLLFSHDAGELEFDDVPPGRARRIGSGRRRSRRG